MAAHSVRLLIEFAFHPPVNPGRVGQYRHALSHAGAADELDTGDYRVLNDILNEIENELRGKGRAGARLVRNWDEQVFVILRTQLNTWLKLGKPACHEDWIKTKYPGGAE